MDSRAKAIEAIANAIYVDNAVPIVLESAKDRATRYINHIESHGLQITPIPAAEMVSVGDVLDNWNRFIATLTAHWTNPDRIMSLLVVQQFDTQFKDRLRESIAAAQPNTLETK